MRTLAGFVAANALLLFAGTGIVAATGLVRLRARELAAAGGLAFLCGVSAIMMIAIAGLVAGVELRFSLYAGVCLVVGGSGLALAWRRRGADDSPEPGLRAWWAGVPTLERVVGAVALAAVLGVFAASALQYSVLPVDQWDEWAMWSKKAVFLLYFGTLDPAFFAAPAYAHMHQEYPLLLPVLEAFIFRGMGTADVSVMHVEFIVLFVAFLWTLAFFGARRGPVLAWGPVLVGIAAAPFIWDQLFSGYADLPVAFLLGAGVLCVALWLEAPRPALVVIAGLLIAGASQTKLEGLVAGVVALAIAAAISWRRDSARTAAQPALAIVAVALALVPWRLWTSAHGVDLYLDIGKGFDIGFLLDNARTAWVTLGIIGEDLGDQSRLIFVVPVALSLVILSIVMRVNRDVALLYLGAAVVQVVFFTWVNTIEPTSFSRRRGIDTIAVIAIVATVHLAAGLAVSLRERDARRAGEERPADRGEPVLAGAAGERG